MSRISSPDHWAQLGQKEQRTLLRFDRQAMLNYNILIMDLTILNNSLIGRDFLRLKNKQDPSIDDFLDYRSRLVELKKLKKFPPEWYDNEICAVDEILKYYSEAERN